MHDFCGQATARYAEEGGKGGVPESVKQAWWEAAPQAAASSHSGAAGARAQADSDLYISNIIRVWIHFASMPLLLDNHC